MSWQPFYRARFKGKAHCILLQQLLLNRLASACVAPCSRASHCSSKHVKSACTCSNNARLGLSSPLLWRARANLFSVNKCSNNYLESHVSILMVYAFKMSKQSSSRKNHDRSITRQFQRKRLNCWAVKKIGVQKFSWRLFNFNFMVPQLFITVV